MATVHHDAGVSPAIILDTLTAFQRTAALRAAIQLNIFGAIGENAGDAASIARRCSASERGVRVLCDCLTVMGFLEKKDGSYRHTPVSAAFLDPQSPACMASIANFLGNAEVMEPFMHLADIVRTGHTLLPGDGSVEPENPIWVEFARSMVPMMAPVAPWVAENVLSGIAGPVRALDIAAGHGLFGIAIARQHPNARVVALDWAPVLELAKVNARNAGVGDRYETLPGDAFKLDYGGQYDVVLLTNFLHHFDRPDCVRLLRKVHAAMKPGGRVAALEFVPNEDRVSPPMPAMFSLAMLTSTPAGDAYTFRELESMYRESGFDRTTAHPAPVGPQTLVRGYAR